MKRGESAKVTIVGSNMVDLITYMDRMPRKGETIFGKDFEMGFGGKGANQAVAASRLGAEVNMVTKVGDDMFGPETIENFENNGVSTDHVEMVGDESSGVAPIFVNEEGDNWIFIIPGANSHVSKGDVDKATEEIASSDLLVLQLEIPKDTVYYAIKKATEVNTPVILNPAPAAQLEVKYLTGLFIFAPNETELETITNSSVDSLEDAKKGARELVEEGIQNVVVTLGKEGSLLVNDKEAVNLSAPAVDPVDTTGAGDAFIGSLSTFWAEGLDLKKAIKKANRYAAISTINRGTQKSFLDREDFLDKKSEL